MTDQTGNVKLSCKNLWKVFGSSADKYFKLPPATPENSTSLAERIKSSGRIAGVCDVSLDFRESEISVVMGLSGSGKSTLVRCLSRLTEPTFGSLSLSGEDMVSMSDQQLLDVRRKKMSMVFQSFGLLPHLNVRDNVTFPLDLQGFDKPEQLARANKVIELVGLAGRENSLPSQLSGGQQQRVGIARSLVVEPEIWFLDEPFSALDPLIRKGLQDELLRLQEKLKKTVIFITHDFEEAMKIADRISIMRNGFVVQSGTPAEIVFKPVDEYVAEFGKDVRKDLLLTAGDAVSRNVDGVGSAEASRKVAEKTPLSKVIEMLLENDTPIKVAGTNGGYVTTRSVFQSVFGK